MRTALFLASAALALWVHAASANDGTDHLLVGIDPVIDCSVRPDAGGGALIAWLLQCTEGGDKWVRVHEPGGDKGGRAEASGGSNDAGRGGGSDKGGSDAGGGECAS